MLVCLGCSQVEVEVLVGEEGISPSEGAEFRDSEEAVIGEVEGQDEEFGLEWLGGVGLGDDMCKVGENVFSEWETSGCGVDGAGSICFECILDCLGVGEDLERWGVVG